MELRCSWLHCERCTVDARAAATEQVKLVAAQRIHRGDFPQFWVWRIREHKTVAPLRGRPMNIRGRVKHRIEHCRNAQAGGGNIRRVYGKATRSGDDLRRDVGVVATIVALIPGKEP